MFVVDIRSNSDQLSQRFTMRVRSGTTQRACTMLRTYAMIYWGGEEVCGYLHSSGTHAMFKVDIHACFDQVVMPVCQRLEAATSAVPHYTHSLGDRTVVHEKFQLIWHARYPSG